MAETWTDIEQMPEYTRLPADKQADLKAEWFKTHLADDPAFQRVAQSNPKTAMDYIARFGEKAQELVMKHPVLGPVLRTMAGATQGMVDIGARAEEALGGAPSKGATIGRSGERVMETAQKLGAPAPVAGAVGFLGELALDPMNTAMGTAIGMIPKAPVVARGAPTPTPKPIVQPGTRQTPPKAPLTPPPTYVGHQAGSENVPGFDLYNLNHDIPGHPIHSTVSENTLRAAGIEPPGGPGSPPPILDRALPEVLRGKPPTAGPPPPQYSPNPPPRIPLIGEPPLSNPFSFKQWWAQYRQHWGAEKPVLDAVPDTPVISGIEGLRVGQEALIVDYTSQPYVRTFLKRTPQDIKKIEWEMVTQARAYEKAGVKDWYQRAINERAPTDVQAILREMEADFKLENAVREKRGLAPLAHDPYPHLPRATTTEWKALHIIGSTEGGGASGLASSIKSFGLERTFRTMSEAEKAPYNIRYIDPRKALLWRKAQGYNLRLSDAFMDEMEAKGVIHINPDLAKIASPTGQVTYLKGLPFQPKRVLPGEVVSGEAPIGPRPPYEGQRLLGREGPGRIPGQEDVVTPKKGLKQDYDTPEGSGWWVRSDEEAWFLRQNLKGTHPWAGDLAYYMNQTVRNPGLMNPFPHLKNMLDKYGASGGSWNPAKMVMDMREWRDGSNPKIKALFEQYVPMTKTSKPVSQIIQSAINTPEKVIGRPWLEKPGAVAENLKQSYANIKSDPTMGGEIAIERLGGLNGWSSKKIFSDWDPAIRYSRFKQYLERGMEPQVAANHSQIDLVRYGARSDRFDFLKSIPGNFFAIWRGGSLRTLMKTAKYSAVRGGMFIAGMDYIREWDYRHNGQYHHHFWDYLERPMAALLRAGGDWAKADTAFKDIKLKVGLQEAGGIALSTAMFGPGGDYTARTIGGMLKTAEGKTDYKDLQRTLMLLGQIYNVIPESESFVRAVDEKRWQAAGAHAANVMGTVAMGRYNAGYRQPDRFMRYMPEWMPGMEKSDYIKSAERVQEMRTTRKDMRTLEEDTHMRQILEKLKGKHLDPNDAILAELANQLPR